MKLYKYSEQNFKDIEKTIKRYASLSSQDKKALNNIAITYKINEQLLEIPGPERSKFRRIRKGSDNLISLLEDIESDLIGDKLHGEAVDLLRRLSNIAFQRSERVWIREPGKKGKDKKMARTQFIISLATVYTKITNRKAGTPNKQDGSYHGNFFDFVDACILPIEHISNSAIGEAILKALSQMKQYPYNHRRELTYLYPSE